MQYAKTYEKDTSVRRRFGVDGGKDEQEVLKGTLVNKPERHLAKRTYS